MATDVITTLNNLIRTCRDGQHGLKTAADHIRDPHVRKILAELASERGELADGLQQEVSRLGGTPSTAGSISGALHRGWLDLRSALTRGDDDIVAEAERGEDVAKHAFESALAAGSAMDPQTRAVVQHVAARVFAAHDRVRNFERSTSQP